MISRRSETSFFKTASLVGESTVSPNDDGTITVSGLTKQTASRKNGRR
jgi:hypothetical protein